MDTPSMAFLGAFLGGTLGLPSGFLLIQVIQWVVAKRERTPESDVFEWAIAQRGVKTVAETQIAGNWVRSYDFHELQALTDDGQWAAMDLSDLPAMYATQVVGSVTLPIVPASNTQELEKNHRDAVIQTRKKLGLGVPQTESMQ